MSYRFPVKIKFELETFGIKIVLVLIHYNISNSKNKLTQDVNNKGKFSTHNAHQLKRGFSTLKMGDEN